MFSIEFAAYRKIFYQRMREVKAVRKGGEPDIEERAIHNRHNRLSDWCIMEIEEAAMRRGHHDTIFLIVWNAIDGLRPIVGSFLIIDKVIGGLSRKLASDGLSLCLVQDFLQDALLQWRGQLGDDEWFERALCSGIGDEIDQVGTFGGVPALYFCDEDVVFGPDCMPGEQNGEPLKCSIEEATGEYLEVCEPVRGRMLLDDGAQLVKAPTSANAKRDDVAEKA